MLIRKKMFIFVVSISVTHAVVRTVRLSIDTARRTYRVSQEALQPGRLAMTGISVWREVHNLKTSEVGCSVRRNMAWYRIL